MNTWLKVRESDGHWHHVAAPGKDGWVHGGDLKVRQDLKIGFVDVGQGDGALIECNEERFLVDGGEFEPRRAHRGIPTARIVPSSISSDDAVAALESAGILA